MDALLMCGGRGTRFEGPHEKPLHPVDGVAMVEHVRRALEAADSVESIYAVVSSNAARTMAHLEATDSVETIETDGDGYVTDLLAALEYPELSKPVLTAAADLPAIEGAGVDRIIIRHGGSTASRTVCVPAALKRRLGVSIDSRLEASPHLVPTGVNIVGTTDEDMRHVSYDPRLAVNVNRLEEIQIAAQIRTTAQERGGQS